MIQGLVWLLPFLYFGYLFEIYNAYALYFIYLQVRFEWIRGLLLISVQFPDATWHVAAMSILFLMLGLGKNEHVHKSVHDQVAHFVNFRQPDHRIHDYSQKAERPHPQSTQVSVYQVNFKLYS